MSTFTPATTTFGTGTGTFGKAWSPEDARDKESSPNGRVQQSRSTDYSSEDEDSEPEAETLLARKPAPNDDAVFKDEITTRGVNDSMDAYLSAYDQALK